jgi:hypothetical protein
MPLEVIRTQQLDQQSQIMCYSRLQAYEAGNVGGFGDRVYLNISWPATALVIRRSVDQSVLVSSPHLGPKTKFLLLSDSCGFAVVRRPLWRENGSVVYNCCWSSPAHSFSDMCPAGLMTIFYILRFETSLTWRARSPYLHALGTRLHAGPLVIKWVRTSSYSKTVVSENVHAF